MTARSLALLERRIAGLEIGRRERIEGEPAKLFRRRAMAWLRWLDAEAETVHPASSRAHGRRNRQTLLDEPPPRLGVAPGPGWSSRSLPSSHRVGFASRLQLDRRERIERQSGTVDAEPARGRCLRPTLADQANTKGPATLVIAKLSYPKTPLTLRMSPPVATTHTPNRSSGTTAKGG